MSDHDDHDDPNYIDTDAPIDPEAIAENARENFSLSDHLSGIKQRRTKVLLFLDGDSVDAYGKLERELEALNLAMGRIDVLKGTDADRKMHASLLERYNELEPRAERAKLKMLQGALSVHLRAYPNIAVDVIRREAFKKFRDKETKQVPAEKEDEFSIFIQRRLMSSSIEGIFDYRSERVTLGDIKPEEVADALAEKLPTVQWQRLNEAFTKLTLTESIATAATTDAGF